MAQLQTFLAQALNGQGQMCFVTGEAGSGETALVLQIADQLLRTAANLRLGQAIPLLFRLRG